MFWHFQISLGQREMSDKDQENIDGFKGQMYHSSNIWILGSNFFWVNGTSFTQAVRLSRRKKFKTNIIKKSDSFSFYFEGLHWVKSHNAQDLLLALHSTYSWKLWGTMDSRNWIWALTDVLSLQSQNNIFTSPWKRFLSHHSLSLSLSVFVLISHS